MFYYAIRNGSDIAEKNWGLAATSWINIGLNGAKSCNFPTNPTNFRRNSDIQWQIFYREDYRRSKFQFSPEIFF